MSMRSGSWQIILADLSLILFVTTLAGLDRVDRHRTGSSKALFEATGPAAPGQALYRDVAGAMPFGDWLRHQAPDPRARLSIQLRYPAGGEAPAWERALSLAKEARAAGFDPRIVLEQGAASEASASLAYDDIQLGENATAQAQITRSRPSSLAR